MKKILLWMFVCIIAPSYYMTGFNRKAHHKRKEHINKIKRDKVKEKIREIKIQRAAPDEKKKLRLQRQRKRFEKRRGIIGYMRDMPKKLIKHGSLKAGQAFLVNEFGQSKTVTITEKGPRKGSSLSGGEGFYLGWFYDLETWKIKHAYLAK